MKTRILRFRTFASYTLALLLIIVSESSIAYAYDYIGFSPYEVHLEVEHYTSNIITIGTVGNNGAPWRLYNDGTVVVDTGFIDWSHNISPWNGVRNYVYRIVFTRPITAGNSLHGLFSQLPYVTIIEGLDYFDTSNVTTMSRMFYEARSLVSLDLSNFDTANVTNMFGMFRGTWSLESLDISHFDTAKVTNMGTMFNAARSLRSLDLSSFDTRNVTNMTDMFLVMPALRELTLGEHFSFFEDASLPNVTRNIHYTGYWRDVATGTIANPRGANVLTSRELMSYFDGILMSGVWVWQTVDNANEQKLPSLEFSFSVQVHLSQDMVGYNANSLRFTWMNNGVYNDSGSILIFPAQSSVNIDFPYSLAEMVESGSWVLYLDILDADGNLLLEYSKDII